MSTESVTPTRYYRCVFRGKTSEDVPFQRVYGTYDRAEALRFSHDIRSSRDDTITREVLDGIFSESFPALELLEEQIGNDIKPVRDIPDAFPVGEGVWDDTNRVQLLKRTLMHTLWNVRKSGRGAGNEITSNLPTYYFAATTDSLLLKFAAIGGTGISAALIYRRHRHMEEFNRALKIWVRFTNNTKIEPERALEILEEDMLNEGLLFSGRPETPMSEFKAAEFRDLAVQKNFWYDSSQIVEHIGSERKLSTLGQIAQLPKKSIDAGFAFSRMVSRTVSAIPRNVLHQAEDFATNWYRPSSYARIGAGFKYGYKMLEDFRLTSNRSRSRLRIKHSQPELDEISIEDNKIIRDTVDPALVRQVAVARQDFRRQVFDGKIMVAGFAAETLFYASHWGELSMNVLELTRGFSEAAAGHGHDATSAFVHGGVALYSLLMVKGAYAEVGEDIRNIFRTAHSRRAEMLDVYPEIERQYVAKNGGQSSARGPDPQALPPPA